MCTCILCMYVACIYSCIVFMYCINVYGCTLAIIVLYVVFVIGKEEQLWAIVKLIIN